MESNLLYSKFSDLNVQFNSVAQLFLKRSSPGSSAGKESACNAGDPSSIPGLGRSPVEGIGHPLIFLGFPGGSDSKESTCNARDLGSTPGLGRSPEGKNGYSLQYSFLENPHGQRSLAGYSPWGCKD